VSDEAVAPISSNPSSDAGRAGAVPVNALLVVGLIAGIVGDALLRGPDPVGINATLWVAFIAIAAFALHRLFGLELSGERRTWVLLAALFAMGFAWRDSPALKFLSFASASMAFGLAAYRVGAAWVRRAGVLEYVRAYATGALHAWTAAALVLVSAARTTARSEVRGRVGWRRAAAFARGLAIAVPFVFVFGALFVSADAVFEKLVLDVFRIDLDRLATHIFIFSISAWLATGYLRGLSTGTALPPLDVLPKRPMLGITEVATALAVIALLFLVFVVVQFRYLFGGNTLVQLTPDLSYAEYARQGFFELVMVVALVVPVLLVADWLRAPGQRRDEIIFRVLAGAQIALVLAVAASALQRLRLYQASYGLTDSRFYAAVLLLWIIAMLVWLAATVLRGRRQAFGFGALVAGYATVALLFAVNPDAIIARTNVARMESTQPLQTPFDVVYATSLSADAAPILLDALPALPADAQCPIASHLLRHWAPDSAHSLRNWNWSAARAREAVRAREAQLRSLVPADLKCPPSTAAPKPSSPS
jgi:uncharacterized protein DUF4153